MLNKLHFYLECYVFIVFIELSFLHEDALHCHVNIFLVSIVDINSYIRIDFPDSFSHTQKSGYVESTSSIIFVKKWCTFIYRLFAYEHNLIS